MLEDIVLRIKELVRLADRKLEPKPITRGRDRLGADAAVLEEDVDCVQGVLSWSNVRFDLAA